MALDAGTLHVTVEFAKDLADKDWFGKQDPYCVITVGGQTARTRTHVDGGRNPVWNETFQFNIVNDNTVHLTLYDEDMLTKDDLIGAAQVSCAHARALGHDHVQAPVRVKSNKQKGFVSIKLSFVSNNVLKPAAQAQAAQPQAAYAPQQPAYPQHNPYAQPPAPYPAPGYPPQPQQPYGYAPQPQTYPSGHYPPPQQQPPPQQAASGYYPAVPTNQPQPHGYPQAPPAGQPPYGYRSS